MIRKIHKIVIGISGKEIAVLECGHYAYIPEWDCKTLTIKVNAINCAKCDEATKLPNTLEEIYKRYWNGKRV